MFHHIVLMEFNKAADKAFFDKVEHYCARIRKEAAGAQAYYMAPNVADRRGPYSHTIVAIFDTSENHDRYQVSPLHQEMKTYMATFIDKILVSDTTG